MHPSHLLARRAQCSDDFQSTLQRPCIHPSHLLARRALMNTPRRSYCEHAAQASAMDQIVLRAREHAAQASAMDQEHVAQASLLVTVGHL